MTGGILLSSLASLAFRKTDPHYQQEKARINDATSMSLAFYLPCSFAATYASSRPTYPHEPTPQSSVHTVAVACCLIRGNGHGFAS